MTNFARIYTYLLFHSINCQRLERHLSVEDARTERSEVTCTGIRHIFLILFGIADSMEIEHIVIWKKNAQSSMKIE